MSKDLIDEYNEALGITVQEEPPRVEVRGVTRSYQYNTEILGDWDSTSINTMLRNYESAYVAANNDGIVIQSPNGQHYIRITNDGITIHGNIRIEEHND